jgi:hypothetical protein
MDIFCSAAMPAASLSLRSQLVGTVACCYWGAIITSYGEAHFNEESTFVKRDHVTTYHRYHSTQDVQATLKPFVWEVPNTFQYSFALIRGSSNSRWHFKQLTYRWEEIK